MQRSDVKFHKVSHFLPFPYFLWLDCSRNGLISCSSAKVSLEWAGLALHGRPLFFPVVCGQHCSFGRWSPATDFSVVWLSTAVLNLAVLFTVVVVGLDTQWNTCCSKEYAFLLFTPVLSSFGGSPDCWIQAPLFASYKKYSLITLLRNQKTIPPQKGMRGSGSRNVYNSLQRQGRGLV